MKNIALALALVLASSSLAVGLASTDANAGGRKICSGAPDTPHGRKAP